MEEIIASPAPTPSHPSEKKAASIGSKFLGFLAKLLFDSMSWFFKGLSSAASMVIGYFMITIAILVVLIAVSDTSITDDGSLDVGDVYRDYGGEDKIALLELNGIITEDDSFVEPFGGGARTITPHGVENALNQAKSDEMVKGLLIYVSSPGGSAVASDRIFKVIKDFKTSKNVPIVILMGDIAASGGYFISTAGDYIFANPATITGSIGVIMETYNLSGLYEKVGVKKETFKAGKYKDILSDNREITDEEREMVNKLMSDAYSLFLSRVSEGRGLPIETVSYFAEGRIYSGVSAKDGKLVDEIGTINDAIAYTAEKASLEKYKVVKLRSSSFIDEFLASIDYKFEGMMSIFSPLRADFPEYRLLYKLN